MGTTGVRSRWDNGLWAHTTEVVRRPEGTYQAVCGCGWRSAAETDREAVLSRCGRERELLSLVERLAAVYTVDTDQVALVGLVRDAQRLVGGGR